MLVYDIQLWIWIDITLVVKFTPLPSTQILIWCMHQKLQAEAHFWNLGHTYPFHHKKIATQTQYIVILFHKSKYNVEDKIRDTTLYDIHNYLYIFHNQIRNTSLPPIIMLERLKKFKYWKDLSCDISLVQIHSLFISCFTTSIIVKT